MRHLLWLSADYSSLSKLKCCTKEHLAKESHKSSCFRSQPETCSFRTVSSCGCDSIMLTDCNTSQMTQNFRSTSLPFLLKYITYLYVNYVCKFPPKYEITKDYSNHNIFPGMTIVLASVHFLQTGERASHT